MTPLFIMRPHSQDLDYALFLKNLIDKAMLDVDSTRDRPLQITNKRFVRRRRLIRICGDYAEQSFDVWT